MRNPGRILLVVLLLTGCFETPVEDARALGLIHPKQSKGGTILGRLPADQVIDGYPCAKGWVHFHPDWSLHFLQLSQAYHWNDLTLPAGTWISIHEEGWIRTVIFPEDTQVQGVAVSGSGGPKGIHTGFYPGGELRYVYPPEDTLIDGVPVISSLIRIVELHPNGHLKRADLAGDYERDGVQFKRRETIRLTPDGQLIRD